MSYGAQGSVEGEGEMSAANSCRKCKFFFMDGEGWKLPQFDYPSCSKTPHMANLSSFPFQKTKCLNYTAVDKARVK
tara:strand:- start:468 stop:695 length:228 start_codon:yes stop_codon:yes gene_type:complete